MRRQDPLITSRSKEGVPKGRLLLLIAILVITAFVYAPALKHSLTNWDDNDYVTDNPYIRDFSSGSVTNILTHPIALNYHPLTMFSLSLNYQWTGLEAWSYILVNILLHLCNVVLTYWFALLIFDRRKAMALFIAAAFALHPMHVESVAWVAERKDVLYTFFFLAGLIAWLSYARGGKWRGYLFALIFFALSALSKPSAVVFPVIILLLDFLDARKAGFRMMALRIPFFVISVVIGVLTLQAQVDKSVVDISQYNFIQQFLFASYGFLIYIVKLFVPVGLSALHPVPVFNTSLELPWIYFAAPVLNAAIILLAAYSLRQTRLVMFGLLFYFVHITLTLQFFQVGSAVIAERYTYLSYTGLLIILAWLIHRAVERKMIGEITAYVGMALFISVLSILAFFQVQVWQDSGTLWSNVIRQYPASATAYSNRGYFYVEKQRLAEAESDFTKAISIRPVFADALNNRGSLYRLQQRYREAIRDYDLVVAIDPNHVRAIAGRGNAYEALNVLDSALYDYDRAYELNPLLASTLADRGSLYFKLGMYEKAIAECNRKMAERPDDKVLYLNRGAAYSSLGRWKEAIEDFGVAIESGTDNVSVYEWRAVAFIKAGRNEEAIADLTEGIRREPGRASFYMNRAVAFRNVGKVREAMEDEAVMHRLSGHSAK